MNRILRCINILLSSINMPAYSGSKDFIEYAKKVYKDFYDNKEYILEEIKKILIENNIDINIVKLDLFGSYYTGKANENSDVDILLQYEGNEKEDNIFNILYGKIYGYGGVYDIFPERVD